MIWPLTKGTPARIILGAGIFVLALGITVLAFQMGGGDGGGDPIEAAPEATATNPASATATNTATRTATSTRTATHTASPTATPTPSPSPTTTPAPPTATPGTTGATSGSSGAAPPPAPTATPSGPGAARLAIPRFGVDSAIEQIGILPNNQMDVPHNPYNTGWYPIYDWPGNGGNALFSAHVDYFPNIRGPFYDLDQMVAGDEVTVTLSDGTVLTYEVIRNTRYQVENMPMVEVIWPSDRPAGEEWITLITCGGDFQSYSGSGGPGYYLHRDVVIAKLKT